MFETRRKLSATRWNACLVITAMMVLSTVLIGTATAQEAGQKTFTTMREASTALYDAAKAGDKAALEAVLGASSAPILASGDAVEDKKNADSFIRRYEQMNRWGKEINGDQTLFLGAENWPFPIPLKKRCRRPVVLRHQGRARRNSLSPYRQQRIRRDSRIGRAGGCPNRLLRRSPRR